MTEMLNKEFSRRSFVKGGGALIVSFSLAGAGLTGKAQAADSPYASNPLDQLQIDSWLAIHADNTASINSGSISQGTGATTGILMIAAEELDMDLSQVSHVRYDTAVTPNTGNKSASNTISRGAGRGIRAAAASAKQALLGLASASLGVPVANLTVASGVVSGGGKTVTYGDLLGGKLFNIRMPASYGIPATGSSNGGLDAGQSPAKPVSQYRLVGTSPPEIDIPSIAAGTFTFIHNVRVPGMLHGRVVRPRGQAVYGFGAPIVSVDESSVKHIPGVRVVRKGDFVGVVAAREYDAIQAAAQLKIKWADPPAALPGHGNEFKRMREIDSAGKTVWSRQSLQGARDVGDVDKALASAAHVVAETYGWPGHVPTPIGASCTVADVTPQGARILSGTQGSYSTQQQVASVLGLPLNKVRVTAVAMGGCYGPAMQFQDAAQSAALMSQLAGAPVRVQFMRWEEVGWSATGPGTLMDVRAGIDGNGNIVGFDYTHFYPQYKQGAVDTTHELTGMPIPAVPSSISGNYWPASMYKTPNNRYLLKSVPLKDNWMKAAWMRLGSSPAATFAGEQVIDELARAAKMDPVAFRMQNVTQGVAKNSLLAVLDAVVKAAGWKPAVTGSSVSGGQNVVSGRGFAWNGGDTADSMKTAAIADVSVDKKTGKVTVKHVYQAFSAGLAVYPEGIENQMVGGITQILSRLLVEQYRYSKTSVTSTDFVNYPILRFKDSPTITPIIIQRTDAQPQGVGEPVTAVAPAAVANAFFDATGVRMRTAPFTPARVRATLKAAGVK